MVDQVIKLKRNTANTNAPDTGDIVVGELAIGAVAGKLYMRKSDDSILTFSDDSNVSTTLTIAADSGSNDTVTVGTNTLTFNGTSNQIGTTVSDNAITIALADNPVIGGTGSIRVPDGTTGQRPGSPAAGMFRYNTTTSKFEGYTDDWGDIGGGGANTFTRNAYTGDGSTTAFTLSQTVNSENDLIVFIEGVFQDQDAYSVSGTTLTFDTAPVNGRGIIVYSVKHTVAGSNLNIDTMTGDGSDTTLSLTISPNDENNTQVFIDGVYQNKSTYSISGSTLTFSTAPPNGSAVECMTFTQTDVNEATYVTANANNSTNETVYPVFVDGATGKQEIETDTGLTYNPSTGNLTIGGALTAATLDISGDIDIDGTLEADAITVNGTTLSETIADTVGAMVSSNTESGITVAYQDSDGTVDFTVGTLNQDTTGNAATATALETARTIGGVSFDGTANINLPGVNAAGNQNTTGSAATLTTARAIALTGDVTGTANFDGSAGISISSSLAADSVDSAEIADGAIDTAHIADDQVTQAKIADDAVGADQLAANSVVSASIVNGSIVAADLADNCITSAKIVNGTIATADIANNAILTQHIDDNQVTGDQIGDDVVLSGTGAVTIPKGTTGQRPSGTAGEFRFNTTTAKFEGHNGTEFGEIGGGSGTSSFTRNAFTGDGSTTGFSLSSAPDSENTLIVFIEGVFQDQDAYSVSGTTLTFGTAPVNGRGIIVYNVKGAVSGTNLNHNQFSGTGTATQFTLNLNPVHENNTMVYIDGVYQNKTSYSVSGTTLDFGSGNAPPNGTTVECMIMNQTDVNVPVDDTISTAKLQALAVTEAKIAVNAVTSLKIAENAITARELATNAIATLYLADDSVTTVKIADNAVTAAKIGQDVLTDQLRGITSAASVGSDALTIDSSEHVTILNDLIVDTTTLKVDSGNNRVGIGTASPASGLHLSGGDNTAAKLTFTNTANSNTYSIHAQNNAHTLKFQEDGATVMSLATGGKLGIGPTGPTPAGPLHVQESVSTAYNGATQLNETLIVDNKNGTDDSGVNNYANLTFRIADGATSYGHLNYVRTGNNTGNFTFTQRTGASTWAEAVRITSDGLTFNGDTAAANALDDYEEGTFQPTPSISGATGSIAFKSAADTLSYTKIGDLVHIQGYLQVDSNTVNGGRLNLGNLPFTSVDSAEASGYSLFTCQLSSGSGSQASGFFTSIGEGLTLLQIQTYTGVGTSNNSAVTMVADSFLFIQGQYKAA